MNRSRLRAVFALVVAALLISNAIAVPGISAQNASPVASPSATPFPGGPLGDHAAWTWSLLNDSGQTVTDAEIEQHLGPEILEQVPAAQIIAGIEQLRQAFAPFTIEPDSIVVSTGEPPTQLGYVISGQDGTRFQVSLALDPESGLLSGFLISPAPPRAASPVASPVPAGITDTEVTFTSGADTLYGSFMTPTGFSPDDSRPAALIISGSGPTDRNGDNPIYPLGTNRNLAVTLAEAGVPSLRYDKLGSGQTGLASHADITDVDYETFLQEVRDAALFLAGQPGVDASQLIIVGHSEGALFALVLAQEMTAAGHPPAGLILVSPLSVRYLDLIREQFETQVAAAVAAEQMTQDEASQFETELAETIERIRTTGQLPGDLSNQALASVFTQESVSFLAQIDRIDPADVAASLPSTLPVLVLLGEKDTQVTAAQVEHLMGGFTQAGNTDAMLITLPKANHALRIIEGTPNPAIDYLDPSLPFSPEAVSAIDAFLTGHGWTPA